MKAENIFKLGQVAGEIKHWNKQIARAKGVNGLDFNERERLAESLQSVARLLEEVANSEAK